MTQILKVKGKIKNAGNRPIITAAGVSPYFLLDARRYDFEEGQKLKSIQAIGTLRHDDLLLNPISGNEFSSVFSREEHPHFKFTPKMGMVTRAYSSRKKPTTVVIVYKLESWEVIRGSDARIYGIGRMQSNKRIFGAPDNRLLLWSSEVGGTGHYFDTKTDNWCIGVHYFNGDKSMLVDRVGSLSHIVLQQEGAELDDVSIWASSVQSNPQTGAVSYLAVYEDEMTEDDLLSLFFEAKNNFNLL